MTTTPLASAAPFLQRLFRDGVPEDLAFEPMQGDGRQDIDIHRLYSTAQTGSTGPSAGIVRYHPGASAAPHVHPGFEPDLRLRRRAWSSTSAGSAPDR
ncbi:hypothetical protein G5V59_04385 [Nocardioides sp. W3-2-3]|uniref:hypothetical protein n=1 Tax=Nocardioides convexus TaxID=2712224 RepID=UPI002418B9C1|nr:hypothetical protein [Nocardioides convexus]NGZ99810.1 hypothetical protein [Nocardioides convexus]